MRKPISELSTKIDNMDAKFTALEETDKLVKSSLLSMQRQDLLKTCESYLKLGYASLRQKETISELYASYHALGGDSFITDLVNQVKELPLEKPKTQKKTRIVESK